MYTQKMGSLASPGLPVFVAANPFGATFKNTFAEKTPSIVYPPSPRLRQVNRPPL